MDFGQMVQQTNDSYYGLLSEEERLIGARENDDWQAHDMAEREGGIVQILRRLEKEGHVTQEEASLLAWAANVKI
jgi:hypothetical protein